MIEDYLKEYIELVRDGQNFTYTNDVYVKFLRYIDNNYGEELLIEMKAQMRQKYLNYNNRVNILRDLGLRPHKNSCDCHGYSWYT